MSYRYLDMEGYNRIKHFEYFSSLAYPYVGITVNVTITDFINTVKERKLPFFLSFCYCISKAANAVPEFRQRIMSGKIVEYDNCRTSHTVALEDETYCYCTLDSTMPFNDYIPYAVKAQEKAKVLRSVEDNQDVNEMIFISTLPWISYTSMIQPVPIPADSNPRITWGKYFRENSETVMPVTVLCHHALVDGMHIARFYKKLEEYISSVPR